MISSPYIDLRYPFRDYQGLFIQHYCPWGVFVSKLDALVWGRGGLQGLGSSVVGAGDELLADDPWTPPRDTTSHEEMGVVDPAADVPSLLRVGSWSWSFLGVRVGVPCPQLVIHDVS